MDANSFHRLVGPTYVINLDNRTDRWQECSQEMQTFGSDLSQVVRFSAVRSTLHGIIGCSLSHAGVLVRFLTETEAPHCLVLEDDFHFLRRLDEVGADIQNFMQSETRWDVLLLSGNAVLAVPTAKPDYHRVITSQTASAYIVTRAAAMRLIPKLLLGADRLRQLLPGLQREHWPLMVHNYANDMIWKDLQREDHWFILSKRTVVQRPSFSDIEQKTVNYGV